MTDFGVRQGREFSLVELLQDDDMASYFEGGELACFRLAPKDYHRYHTPVDAVVGRTKFIHGEYLVSCYSTQSTEPSLTSLLVIL